MENKCKKVKEAVLVAVIAGISCLIGAGVSTYIDKELRKDYFNGGYEAGYYQALSDVENGPIQIEVRVKEFQEDKLK